MTREENNPKEVGFLRFLIPLFILVLIISACAPPTQDQAPPQATDTPQAEIPDTLPPPPSPTFTLEPITPPTFTPMPYVMISGNTNCRTGPGSVYDWLHTYLAGDQALILGKNANASFWFISDQDGINPDCWLWGNYATPAGDTAFIPVFTPPPTPTPSPDFEVAYVNSSGAAGSLYLFLEIINTGSVTWESAMLYLYEPTVPQDSGRFSNTFQVNDQSELPTMANIPPGNTGYFLSARLVNPGGYGKTGDVVDFYFVACTQEYMGGTCITKMWTESVW